MLPRGNLAESAPCCQPLTAISLPAACLCLPLCSRVQDMFHSVQLNVNNPHFLIMQGRINKVRLGRASACCEAA